VAVLAYGLQVRIAVVASRGLVEHVVNLSSLGHSIFLETGLTEPIVSIENATAYLLPLPAIASFRSLLRLGGLALP